MLKESVVEAIRGGKFHIWAIKTVDEGAALAEHMKEFARPEGAKAKRG